MRLLRLLLLLAPDDDRLLLLAVPDHDVEPPRVYVRLRQVGVMGRQWGRVTSWWWDNLVLLWLLLLLLCWSLLQDGNKRARLLWLVTPNDFLVMNTLNAFWNVIDSLFIEGCPCSLALWWHLLDLHQLLLSCNHLHARELDCWHLWRLWYIRAAGVVQLIEATEGAAAVIILHLLLLPSLLVKHGLGLCSSYGHSLSICLVQGIILV